MKKNYLILISLLACLFFFAGCKKGELIVTFNPNGGKGKLVTQNFTQEMAQPLMANSFTYWGFTFTGWNTTPDGKGTAYKDQEPIRITEHLVLYAQWAPVSGDFTVTFNANGGIGEMPSQMFKANVAQAIAPNAFYYEGYRFTGWNTSPNGNGKEYANEQNITVTADMTLYAQWLPVANTYFVIFDANGGEGTMEPQEFKSNEYKELEENTFTHPDLIFKNWNTKADGSGVSLPDKAWLQINANAVLYAQWEEPEEKNNK